MARIADRSNGADFRSAFSALIVCLVVTLVLITPSAAGQTRAFQGSGAAEIGPDSLAAREKACAGATRSAIELAIKSILDANTINANKRDIDDMLAGANRYAQRTEVLQEGPNGQEYRCRVRVTADTGLLSKDFKESSILSGRALGPRIMVIVDEYRLDRPTIEPAEARKDNDLLLRYKEYFPALPPVSNGSAAAAFVKTLRDRDYQVVDEEYARTIREQRIGVMRDFISDSSRVAALAKEMGAARNVGWLVLGGTKVVGKEPTGSRFVADAAMVARIVDTSTGEIIASEEGTKSIEETSRETAMSEAGAAVSRALGDKLAGQMAEYAARRASLGTRMSVNLFKVARAETALAFQAYLKSLPGVTEVQQLNFDGTNNLLELNVAFQGASADLSKLIFDELSRAPELSQLRLQQSGGSAVDFVLDPSVTRGFSALSFEVRLDDANQDKMLEGGKRFNIRVSVKNSGTGPANNVQVRLAGDPTIVSAAGSQKAAASIAPGQTQTVDFSGVVPPQAEARDAEIRVTLSEGSSQLPQSEVLRVALVPAIDVDYPPLPVYLPERASSIAVVVGISNYRESGIPKLPYASHDAEIFAKYLENVAGVRKENIKTLSDDRAARSDIEDAVERWLPLRAQNASQVYFYYAGHGALDPATGDAYLVPYEGSPDAPETRMYPLKRLYEKLGQLKAENVTVFLDSCFSGGGRSIAMRGRPIVITSNTGPPSNMNNVSVLAAAAANQVSSDYDRMRHGMFTYFLLKGIRGEAGAGSDGWIDLGKLSAFVTDKVRSTAATELSREQTPVLIGGPDLDSKKNAKLFKIQK